MRTLGLEGGIVDEAVYARTVERFRERRILLPTFAQLAEPRLIPAPIRQALAAVEPDEAHPLNLFRVHWYNDADRSVTGRRPRARGAGRASSPGSTPRIVVALGDRFPMIRAHKVLAAYGCLAPRRRHRASSTRRPTGPCGPPPATTAAAAWPSRASWAAGASPCCRRG